MGIDITYKRNSTHSWGEALGFGKDAENDFLLRAAIDETDISFWRHLYGLDYFAHRVDNDEDVVDVVPCGITSERCQWSDI